MTSIFQGALVAGAGSLAGGLLLLRMLRTRLSAPEALGLAWFAGAPVWSALVLALASSHLARRSVVTALAAVLLLLALWLARPVWSGELPTLPRAWKTAFAVVASAYAVVLLPAVLAPDTTPLSSDGLLYGASLLARGIPAGFHPLQGLWLSAFLPGRHSAVALLNLTALAALATSLYSAAARFSSPKAGAVAAMLGLTAPALWIPATEAAPAIWQTAGLFSFVWAIALAWKAKQPQLALAALVASLCLWPPLDRWSGAFRGFPFQFLPLLLVPFAALLLGFLFSRNTAAAAILVAFQALSSCPLWVDRLAPSPWRAPAPVLWTDVGKAVDHEQFLDTRLPRYGETRWAEQELPPGAILLTDRPLPRSWLRQRSLTDSELWAMGERAAAGLSAKRLNLPGTPTTELIVPAPGTIAEVRIFRGSAEISRDPSWRTDCPEALDNSPATACAGPVRVVFPQPIEVDSAEVIGSDGNQAVLASGVRKAAAAEWKRRGITHLLVHESGAVPGDLHRNAPYWGVTQIGAIGDAHLFRID